MSTGRSPMEVDTGRRPNPALWMIEDQASFVSTRAEAIESAQRHLDQAQEHQRQYYDRGGSDVQFKVGDFVYVKAQLLNTNHMTRADYDPDRDPTVNKLLPKRLGPFPIEKVLGPSTYRLVLPEVLRFHRSFNIDQIKLSFGCPPQFIGRPIRLTAPVLFDDNGNRIYVVAALLRRRRGRVRYLVQRTDLL